MLISLFGTLLLGIKNYGLKIEKVEAAVIYIMLPEAGP
jgi:hypothetical protein